MVYLLPEGSDAASTAGLSQSIKEYLLGGGILAALIAFVLTFFLSRKITAPIHSLTLAAKRLGEGDLSQRVKVGGKDEIGQLTRSFNTMADGFERTEKLLRNMVADSAHELRTPVSNIRGYLEAVRDGVVEPDTATVNLLYEETMQLSRLIEDLQDLTLSDAGELKLSRQVENIAELIAHTIAIQVQASNKGISISADIQDNLPLVYIDRHRIGEVLRNLLDNAVVHTDKGGTITVTARQEGSLMKIAVSDNGEGIPVAEMNNIFERFYRVDTARSRELGGTGLGLSIVKHIVQAHGGSCAVESIPGTGSTFSFTMRKA